MSFNILTLDSIFVTLPRGTSLCSDDVLLLFCVNPFCALRVGIVSALQWVI